MASLEPWFLGVICGLAGLILILVISITILCLIWSRKDKRHQKKKPASALHTSFTEIVAEQERQNPGIPKSRCINSNWFLQESEDSQISAVETNGKPKISGKEPFVVGTSLLKFSQELDKASLTSQNQPVSGTRVQGSFNTEVDGEKREKKTPDNEEKMIRLGLIPPRPIPRTTSDVGGARPNQKRMWSGDSGTTLELSAHPPLPSDIQATATNGLDAQGNNEANWVAMKGREMQIWERSSASVGGKVNPGFTAYSLPKEDYDLKGAQWYENKSDPFYDSHVQRLKEKFSSPKPAEQRTSAAVIVQRQPRNNLRHTYGGKNSSPAWAGESAAKSNNRLSLRAEEDIPSIWQIIPEDPEELKDDKINRVRRIGVPILPL